MYGDIFFFLMKMCMVTLISSIAGSNIIITYILLLCITILL